jgi:cyanate permease
LTVGNVTALSPIIVRREFGAQAFGLVFGVASCGIQLTAALGPGFYGILHETFGSYDPALIGAAGLDVAAAVIAIAGHREPARRASLSSKAKPSFRAQNLISRDGSS